MVNAELFRPLRFAVKTTVSVATFSTDDASVTTSETTGSSLSAIVTVADAGEPNA